MSYEFAAKIWSFKQTIAGAERALRHYVRRLTITLPQEPRILDAGCGTGTMGLAFLEKHPTARVVETDFSTDMLRHVERRAVRLDPGLARVIIGQGDIQSPDHVRILSSGQEIILGPETFDLVIAGAVLEHVDIERSLTGLTALVRKGGFLLINLMQENLFTKISRSLYGFHFLDPQGVVMRLRNLGYSSVEIVPFSFSEFPMNIYRVGILCQR